MTHLNSFSQYSRNENWIRWYAKVAKLKGLRTVQILQEYKDEDAVLLDLGCGIGLTLSILAQAFPNSVGCDIDKNGVEATQKILQNVNVSIPVTLYDGNILPFKDNTFDIVTSIEVIEHVKDPAKMLSEIRRVLKKDGILHITTANKWWPYEPHFKLLFLSYLPENLADAYVNLSGKGQSYENIKLPSYTKFKKLVLENFNVEDITLNLIENYEKYNFQLERGRKVIVVGFLLKLLRKTEKFKGGRIFNKFLKSSLLHVSLGWLFIARPRK